MSTKNDVTLVLKDSQTDYLKTMAEKYGIADESKVVRCLLDFAIQNPDQETVFYQEIRCLDC